jgi:hypothetical protein
MCNVAYAGAVQLRHHSGFSRAVEVTWRKRQMRSHHHSVRRTIESRSKPEQRVEATDALLQDTVERLSRRCPPHLVRVAARENLLELRPHLKDALVALADIEGRRNLTDEELALRRAFKTVLLAEMLLP